MGTFKISLKRILCFAWIFWIVLPVPAEAQIMSLEDSWRWIQFNKQHGLPHRQVFMLEETDDGTLWAGTFNGLAWYDGYSWHAMGIGDGLPEIKPRSIHRRVGGGIFVVVGDRLYSGDQGGLQLVHLPFDVQSAAVLPDGSLLLLSDGILHCYLDGELTPVAGPSGLSAEEYTSLEQTSTGTVWLEVFNALYRFESGTWVSEQSGQNFYHITEDSKGLRFASAQVPVEARGLWMWESDSSPRRYQGGVIDLIESIACSMDGRVVVVYESGDVLVRWQDSWTMLDRLPKQLKNILSVGFLANGDLWIGTEEGLYIQRSSSQLWTRWVQAATSLRNRVDEILVTHDGSVWLGTDGGIEIHHSDGTEEWIDHIGETKLSIITGLAEDPEGHIWVTSGA